MTRLSLASGTNLETDTFLTAEGAEDAEATAKSRLASGARLCSTLPALLAVGTAHGPSPIASYVCSVRRTASNVALIFST